MPRMSKAESAAAKRTLERNIVQYEKSKQERSKMTDSINAKIRAIHPSGFPIEIDMIDTSADSIDKMVEALQARKYTYAVRAAASMRNTDNDGKTAKVESITPVPGKKQWMVKALITEAGAGYQEFMVFSATEFRIGDLIRLHVNEKGYYNGTLLVLENVGNGPAKPF